MKKAMPSPSRIALAAALGLAGGGLAYAQSSGQQPGGAAAPSQAQTRSGQSGQVQQQTGQHQAAFNRVNVVRASSIVGQPLLDQSGERLGELEYMMIDPVDGSVDFLVLGRGGILDLGEQLVPIPWGHVDVRPGSDGQIRMTLSADAPSIDQAPRISYSTLRQLTQPTFITQVLTFYGPAPAGQGAGTGQGAGGGEQDMARPQAQKSPSRPPTSGEQGREQPKSSTGAGGTTGKQSQAAAGTDSGTAGASNSSGSAASTPQNERQQVQEQMDRQRSLQQSQGRAGTARTQEQARSGRLQGSEPQGGQAEGRPGDNAIVVGRGIVTTLGAPLVDWRSDIVGAQVVTRDGREVGDIDQLVIDTDRGRVAYAVIAEGGFLGFGETFRPVPLQALTWQGQGTFVLDTTVSDLNAVPPLTGTSYPTRVRRGDIETLYRRFDLKPYWQS